MKEYQQQKERATQMRSELQKGLEATRQGARAGKEGFTTDSRLKDREVEKGKGGVEDGAGTTNKDSGPSHFDTTKKRQGEYMEDRTKAEYEQTYDGQREKDLGKDPLYLQNQWNDSGNPGYTRVRNFGLNKDPQLNGNAQPNAAQNKDESVIRKERVPPAYQKIVRDYFEKIEE
jgi:hypothetical protein